MSLIIQEIQTKLKNNNFYTGSIDGIAGDMTINAVKQAIDKGICSDKDLYECINPLITTNFRLSEFIISPTASRLDIDNTPNQMIKNHLIESCINLWQPARDILGQSMLISSGYRCPALNRAVGGSDTSAHDDGYAIDFTSPSFGNTRQIANKLANEFKAKGIKFDQIILEYPDTNNSWVHLGYKTADGRQRNQLLTAKRINGKTKYLTGLL